MIYYSFLLLILAFIVQTINVQNYKKENKRVIESRNRLNRYHYQDVCSLMYQLKDIDDYNFDIKQKYNLKRDAINRIIEDYTQKERELSTQNSTSNR